MARKGKKERRHRASAAARQATTNYKQEVASGGGGNLWNLPEGIEEVDLLDKKGVTKIVDIVPYEVTQKGHPNSIPVGDWFWTRTVRIHWGIGAKGGPVVCLASLNKACPVCEYIREMGKDPDADQEELDNLKSKPLGIYNIILPEEAPDEPKFLAISPFKFGQKLAAELDFADEEEVDFWMPDSGISLECRIEETRIGKGPKFLTVGKMDLVERDHDYDDDIVKETVDLDSAINALDYEELRKKFYMVEDDGSEGGEDDAGEDTDDGGKRKRRKKKQKADSSKEDEEDGTDEETAEVNEEAESGEEGSEEELTEEAQAAIDDAREDEVCKACQGTGQASKGGECGPCKGKGIKPKEKKADSSKKRKRSSSQKEDNTAEETGKSSSKKRRSTKKSNEEGPECPKGHNFGHDCDEYDDCEECPEETWQKCAEKRDEIEAANK